MSSLPCFNSSLEKIYKNLKTIEFIDTTEPLLVDIHKKMSKNLLSLVKVLIVSLFLNSFFSTY